MSLYTMSLLQQHLLIFKIRFSYQHGQTKFTQETGKEKFNEGSKTRAALSFFNHRFGLSMSAG